MLPAMDSSKGPNRRNGTDLSDNPTANAYTADTDCDLLLGGEEEYSHPYSDEYVFLEKRMRNRLAFFFMNPIEKWKTRRRFPYKFLIQVIKIVLVTIQLSLFAHTRYSHVNYTWGNRITFSHLFLKDWDAAREVVSYPPALGPYAIYDVKSFYSTINYAIVGYANIKNAIGSYSYMSEDNKIVYPLLCTLHYKEGMIFGFNESYAFDGEIVQECLNITITDNVKKYGFSIENYLRDHNATISFSSLLKLKLKFALKTVNFRAAGKFSPPDCYKFEIQITLDNEDMDGQVLVGLDVNPFRLNCKGDIEYITDNKMESFFRSLLNYFVIITCTISVILCSRAIFRAQLLKYETIRYFDEMLKSTLSCSGRWAFWNLWYIMIIINDILIICGSSIKEQIETKQFIGDQWNLCSVLLGTGNLLVWFGVLRYLTFFKTYNGVILTLRQAFPNTSRFLLCAILLYAGFTFCGWLVLGPYHMKFRSLASTSECLFSLINGDDMYATFSIMATKSTLLWWFSRLYLYCFISLFIYVVINLFLSVIIDSYETIKNHSRDDLPKSDLEVFITEGTFPTSTFDITEETENWAHVSFAQAVKSIFCSYCINFQHLRKWLAYVYEPSRNYNIYLK
ncbi:mucolipin-3-like isoform X2 [Adelges cooleyi]|uniref:mucolipin-3-like isoform X2 n=1 Tax=Adelges cooleyi TaxID=133065 RepID=UPI00217F6AAB|nr:mucolipin-3-like isoform X2 [Adelges cooleyi]